MVCFASQNNSDSIYFSELLQNAKLAKSAYQTEDEIRQFTKDIDVDLTIYNVIPDAQVAYFLATDNQSQQQTIAVRGTSNIENPMIDASLKLVLDERSNLFLHQGFSRVAQQIYAALKPLLNEDFKINTTGHSLGGAIAMILAIYIEQDGFTPGNVRTFGQPKVTNLAGANSLSELDIIRVVTGRDLVPLIPLLDPLDINDLDVNWHAEKEIILLQKGNFAVLNGVDSMLRAALFTQQPLDWKNLQHHKMEHYYDNLNLLNVTSSKVNLKIGIELFNFVKE